MCCTSGKAELKDTILYANRITKNDKIVHVLGYQNRAINLESGPNAMILPFPAKSPMTSANMVDTSNNKSILKRMASVIANHGQRLTKSAPRSFSVEIFDSGEYTVVLASNPDLIPSALLDVPENKRPNIDPSFFAAYNKWYPGWPVAVCCFEASSEIDAAPLLWWYEPIDDSRFFLPTLDSHGSVPDLDKKVKVDHTIIMGSNAQHAFIVDYRSDISNIKEYLSPKILGRKIEGRYKNGDFYMYADGSGNPKFDRLDPIEARV